jgi:hypothetical protein
MNQSKVFNNLRTGRWPPACPDIDICGFKLKWFYLLSDGIYPAVRYLVSSFNRPWILKENLYAKQQEGARKAVERVFGVLSVSKSVISLLNFGMLKIWSLL